MGTMAQGRKAIRAWANDAIVSFCGCDGSHEQQVRGGKDLYDLRIQTTVPLWGEAGQDLRQELEGRSACFSMLLYSN